MQNKKKRLRKICFGNILRCFGLLAELFFLIPSNYKRYSNAERRKRPVNIEEKISDANWAAVK